MYNFKNFQAFLYFHAKLFAGLLYVIWFSAGIIEAFSLDVAMQSLIQPKITHFVFVFFLSFFPFYFLHKEEKENFLSLYSLHLYALLCELFCFVYYLGLVYSFSALEEFRYFYFVALGFYVIAFALALPKLRFKPLLLGSSVAAGFSFFFVVSMYLS